MERNYKIVQVKVGEQYKYKNVPGKLMVKRQTAASNDPQYLFVGQTAWTTNGLSDQGIRKEDRLGYAELDFATGTIIIPNFPRTTLAPTLFHLKSRA
ncbi:hypothetical protein niasHT_027905 [Heterodera trifolii]|uniref:Uncharacterized protein n=1 Tax=Heterodera trifolii TaxID=157864 RepID=A0ABD2JE15_9BILA